MKKSSENKNTVFKRTKRQMKKSILLPLGGVFALLYIAFCISTSLFSVNNHAISFTESTTRIIQNINSYIDLNYSLNTSVTENSKVIDYMAGKDIDKEEIKNILDYRQKESSGIFGLTLIPRDTSIQPVTFDDSESANFIELKEDQETKMFLISSASKHFGIRINGLNKSYNLQPTNYEKPCITIMNKIYYENILKGVLVLDFESDYLLNLISVDNFKSKNKSFTKIITNGNLNIGNGDQQYANDFEAEKIVYKRNTFEYKTLLNQDIFIYIQSDIDDLIWADFYFLLIYFVSFILILIVSYFMTRRYINNIFDPLEHINHQIRKTLE